jgi:hypothetical protein
MMPALFLLLFCSGFAVAGQETYWKGDIEPKVLKNTPVFPVDQIDYTKQRASKQEIALIKQYYKHPSITDKVQASKYIAIGFIYTMPTRVTNARNGLSGSTPITQAVISDFNKNHSSNVILNKRPFGFGLAFGSQVSYSVKREFEFIFYQASYLYNNSNPMATNQTDASKLKIIYKENGVDITALFDNAEYIRRNISFHYNLQKDFNNFFSDNSDAFLNKVIPFIIGGIGLTSRVSMIRVSNGILGNGNGIDDIMTTVNYLRIMPSVNLGIGIRYKINDTFAFNLKINTIQVVNDINLSGNYIMQGGFVVFF